MLLSNRRIIRGILGLIILFSYICMFVPHYASDTYHAIINADTYGRGNIVLGRYSNELVYSIAIKLGIDYIKMFSLLIAADIIGFIIMADTIVSSALELLHRESNTAVGIIMMSALFCVVNPFISEWFAFYECSLQWVGCVIFSALAIKTFSYDDYNIKRWIISLVFMLISLGFYQAFMPVYVIIGCTFVYLKADGKLNRFSITKTISVCTIGGISSVINILSIRLFQFLGLASITSRTDSINFEILLGNIRTLIQYFPVLLWETCGLFPKGLLVSASLILLSVAVWAIASKEDMVTNKILYIVLLLLGCISVVFVPHVFTSTIWLAQRTIVGLWSIIFSISVIVVVNTNNIRHERLIFGIVCLLLVISIYMIQSIQADLIATNYIDRNEAYAIQQKINEYEVVNGIEIKEIGTISDKNLTYHSAGGKYRYCDTNVSAHAIPWAVINCLNYYNGTSYEVTDVPQTIINAYSDYDRDYLCLEEQLIFDQDKLYIVEY